MKKVYTKIVKRMLKGFYVKLPEEQIEFLKKQKNASELIRDLLEQKMIHEKKYQFLVGIQDYDFELNSANITGIAKMSRLGIPTVPDFFVMLPDVYKYFLKKNRLPEKAVNELKEIFIKIRKNGDTLSVRPSIFSLDEPGLGLSVSNTINISTFDRVKESIVNGYKIVKDTSKNPNDVEFAVIIYPFYTSNKCGLLHIERNSEMIHIESVFGEHTKLITRGVIEPDVYEVEKENLDIVSKKILKKDVTLKKTENGLEYVKLSDREAMKAVLSDKQIKELVKHAKKLEKVYGSQELEWAVLRNGKIIIQETRDLTIKKSPKTSSNVIVVYPGEIEEDAFETREITRKEKLRDKIVVTDNLDVGFITKLVYKVKPKAVILTRGSITTHAATILRKSKIPTIIIKGFSVTNGQKIKINKEGYVEK